MAADEEDIEVHIQLRDDLSAPARLAAESLDELERAAKKARRELALLQTQMAATGATSKRYTAQIQAYTNALNKAKTAHKQVAQQQQKNTQATGKATAATTKLAKETKKASKEKNNFFKTLKQVWSWVTRLTRGLLLLSAAFGVLAGVVHLLGTAQSLLAVIPALASISSFVFLLPTAIGSLLVSLIALKLAFQGVGAGIKAAMSGDQKAFEESLKKLTPSAQKFLKVIRQYAPQLKRIQQVVQEAFFAKIYKSLEPLLKVLIPELTDGLSMVADELGLFVSDFMNWLRSKPGQGFIDSFMVGGADLIHGLRMGLIPLLTGMSNLVQKVAPYWKEFTDAIGRTMGRFGDWLTNISTDGRLERWIDMGIKAFGSLWSILSSIWNIVETVLLNLGDGQQILANVAIILNTVATALASEDGQKGIAAVLTLLMSLLSILNPILSIFIGAITDIIAPSLLAIIQGLAPGLTVLLGALAMGLQALMPYWGPVASAIGDLLTALAPILPVIGQLVGLIANDLALAISFLAKILGPIIQAVMIPFSTWLQLAADAWAQNGPQIVALIDLFAKNLEQLIPFAEQFATLLATQFAEYLPMTTEIIQQLVPVLTHLAEVMGKYLAKELELLAPMLPDLVDAFFQLMESLILLVPAMIPLIDTFTQLLEDVIIPNLPFIFELVKLMIQLAVIFLQAAAFAVKFSAGLLYIANVMNGELLKLFGKLFNVIIKPFEKAFTWIMDNFIGPLLRAVSDLLDAIMGTKNAAAGGFSGSGRTLPGRWTGGPVEAGKSYMTGELGPEIFVDRQGNTKMLGEFGPQVQNFVNDGFVIPNHMMHMWEDIRDNVGKQHQATADRTNEQLMALAGARGSNVENHEHYTYDIDVDARGSDTKPQDIRREVKRAISEIEEERRQRK